MRAALIGNPNVGKTTIFNALCRKNKHTGNWAGKTVEKARGSFVFGGEKTEIIDLPGTYSLESYSKEEEETKKMIKNCDAAVIVTDALFLKRGLCLAYEVLALKLPTLVIINLKDEAEKKGISFDIEKLKSILGTQVLFISAKSKTDIEKVKKSIFSIQKSTKSFPENFDSIRLWAQLCLKDIDFKSRKRSYETDRRITGKAGVLLLLLLVCGVFWLTLFGANLPSSALSSVFGIFRHFVYNLFTFAAAPEVITTLVMQVLGVLLTVVAVMLPPMAIFFPLFSFLEETGYLPRAAFCADKAFASSGADGKQALTTCMGFGCNAAGVIGARIIADRKKRFLAVISNSFIPCNGKLPMLMTLLTAFCVMTGINNTAFAALLFIPIVFFGVLLSLFSTKLLSSTCIKTKNSLFALELVPMRMVSPLKILINTLKDKTLKVLLRACISAIPAGIIIWALTYFSYDGLPLIRHLCSFLHPFGVFIGLDGVMIAAFLLGMPANEIVLPIALMIYTSSSSLVYAPDTALVFMQNGWTFETALCAVIFALCHFPCTTTMMTIAKETKSARATLLSFALPLLFGIIICMIISHII